MESITDSIPMAGLLLLTLVFGLIAIELGYRYGQRRRREDGEKEMEAPVGAMVGAALGLLVFFLAFVFSLASSRYDTRRQLLVDDTNAIGTTWLRTSFLPDALRVNSRKLLQDYVDNRLDAVKNGATAEMLAKNDRLLVSLWADAVAAGRADPSSEMISLYVDALNHMIDLHTYRLQAGVRSRIPDTIWWALLLLNVLGFATMGYHSGIIGARRSPVSFVVALTVAVMVWLIADLDNPRAGYLKINQQPMIELRQSMGP